MAKHIDLRADPISAFTCRKCGKPVDARDLSPFETIACAACGRPQPVPVRLGSFLLIDLLGAGGMGAVYLAKDEQLGRLVAMKIISPEHMTSSDVDAFLTEARAAAAINHRNVVQIYSCGREKEQPYIVMELVDGGRLDKMMTGGKKQEELRMLRTAMDVAEGLRAAHDRGIVHADIKPANILYDKQGVAKVADFGLARFVAGSSKVTDAEGRATEVWGTPHYLAPEKARGKPGDARVDIYSLGATLFHALAGEPPFDGPTAQEVVLARLRSMPPNIGDLRPDLHPKTVEVIMRMLEPEPVRRYPTVASLISDLKQAIEEAQKPLPTPKRASKRGLWIGIGATAALVAALAGVLVFWKTSGKKEFAPPPTTTTQTAGGTQTVATVKAPEPPPSLQPFNAAADKLLSNALDLSAERPLVTEAEFQDLLRLAPPGGPGHTWLCVLYGMFKADQKQMPNFTNSLRRVTGLVTGEVPAALAMPVAVSRFLLGDADANEFLAARTNAPPWFADFASYCLGWRDARRHQMTADSAKALQAYTEASPFPEGPLWPYGYQKQARKILASLDAWKTLESQAKDLFGKSLYDQALALMNVGRAKVVPEYMAAFQALYNQISAAAARQKTAQENKARQERMANARKEQARLQEKIQSELDALDEVREAAVPALKARDFARALALAEKAALSMTTVEGRLAAGALKETYVRLDTLKQWMIAGINSRPYRPRIANSEWRGAVTRATPQGIYEDLGYGATPRAWEAVDWRAFVEMASDFVQEAALPDAERMDRMLSVAVFCYLNGALGPATTLAERVVKSQPALAPVARRLMPDLLPE